MNGEANRARQRQNKAIIAADVRRFVHVINTDGVLGTHSPIIWKSWQTDLTVRRLLTSLQANIVKGHGREHTRNMFWDSTWANNANFVTANVGVDPVMGQGAAASVHVKDGWSGNETDFTLDRFVTLKGGEYFFAPSRDFLKDV